MDWRNKIFNWCTRQEEEVRWDDMRVGKLVWLLRGEKKKVSFSLFFFFICQGVSSELNKKIGCWRCCGAVVADGG